MPSRDSVPYDSATHELRPGPRAEPSPDRRPTSRRGDAPLAIFMFLMDVVAVVGTAVFLAFQSSGSGGSSGWSGATTEWGAVIGFGVVAAVVALTARAFLRGAFVITGAVQAVVAALIAIGAVALAVESGQAPRPASAPAFEQTCVCPSGGGACECPGG
ncbi:DUF6234 family protein [Streptomyces finlayi]|uniref:DUF6234 family protein n=1 Tax=Streptomyces finlayi TaxID=67296 RepID=UPI00227D8D0A|nr:DUF6234 family protein [Streptomyces finlayi]